MYVTSYGVTKSAVINQDFLADIKIAMILFECFIHHLHKIQNRVSMTR